MRDAARAVGVAEQTVWRRMRTEKFRARIAELRNIAVERAMGKVCDGLDNATDVLRCLLASDSEGIALRAAIAHLDQIIKLRDTTELVARIEALERATNGNCKPEPTRSEVDDGDDTESA